MRGLSVSTTEAGVRSQTFIHLSTLWLSYPSSEASQSDVERHNLGPTSGNAIIQSLIRSKNDYLGVVNADGKLQSLGKITPEFDLMVTGCPSSKNETKGQSSVVGEALPLEQNGAAEAILADPYLTDDVIYNLIFQHLHLSSPGILYTTLKHILRHHTLPDFVNSPGSNFGLMKQLRLLFPEKKVCDPKKALEIVRRIWTRIVLKWEELPEIPSSYNNKEAERFIDLSLAMFGMSDCFTTASHIHQYLEVLKNTPSGAKLKAKLEINKNQKDDMYVAGGYCFSLADGRVRDCMKKKYRNTGKMKKKSVELLYCIIDMLNCIDIPDLDSITIWRSNELKLIWQILVRLIVIP